MGKTKAPPVSLGSSLKSVIQILEEDTSTMTIEMRMRDRRVIITRFISEEIGDAYRLIFQRAVPKNQLPIIQEMLSIDDGNPFFGATLVRNKILMSEIIISREAYEALIIGFFKLENPNMSVDMQVLITEKNN